MRILQIKTNDELNIALARVEEILQTEDVKELEELDVLENLIIDYQDKILIEDRKTQSEVEVKINDL